LATIINNPLDVVKTRVQANPMANNPNRNPDLTTITLSSKACVASKASADISVASAPRSSLFIVIQVLKDEGVGGLARGLPARLMRSAPGHGLLYMAFEHFSRLLRAAPAPL